MHLNIPGKGLVVPGHAGDKFVFQDIKSGADRGTTQFNRGE